MNYLNIKLLSFYLGKFGFIILFLFNYHYFNYKLIFILNIIHNQLYTYKLKY